MSWVRRALDGASELPVADLLRNRASDLEGRLLSGLKLRLDGLDAPDRALTHIVVQDPPREGDRSSPAERFARLAQASVDQTTASALEAWQSWLISQLLPDELRILRCASDGSGIAICHLEAVGRLGGDGERLRSNLSRVAQEAGVMVAVAVPAYLSHLLALGMLEPGPEDREAAQTYEIIENDSGTRKLCAEIETRMKRRPRFLRRTLKLSAAGEYFLRSCGAGDAHNETGE